MYRSLPGLGIRGGTGRIFRRTENPSTTYRCPETSDAGSAEALAAGPGRCPEGLASARVTAASVRSPALSAVPAAPAALLPATSVSAAFVPATAVAVPSSVTPAVADEAAGIPASAAGKVRATSAAAPGSGISEELMRRNSAPPKPAAITIAAMPTHSAQSNRRAGLIRTGSCPCGFSSLSNAGASVKFLNLSTPTPSMVSTSPSRVRESQRS